MIFGTGGLMGGKHGGGGGKGDEWCMQGRIEEIGRCTGGGHPDTQLNGSGGAENPQLSIRNNL